MDAAMAVAPPFLVDVAVNLTDCVFRGIGWNGKRLHLDDFDYVLGRAASVGVHQMITTGTSLRQCEEAILLCHRYPKVLFCTVGVHPAHCVEFMRPTDSATTEYSNENSTPGLALNPTKAPVLADFGETYAQEHLRQLVRLIEKNHDVVVAVGEIGLDYAELSCCPSEIQQKYFIVQLHEFAVLGLPFVFHSRDCGMKFVELLRNALASWPSSCPPLRGVVHSFNGTREEQDALLSMGLYLSVNGSAFRNHELALQVISSIPRDRLLMETDAPWCDIRATDYGFQFVSTRFDTTPRKKPFILGKCRERRNEPCHLVQVLEAYIGLTRDAARRGLLLRDDGPYFDCLTRQELTAILYENAKRLFRL